MASFHNSHADRLADIFSHYAISAVRPIEITLHDLSLISEATPK
jgi:hypothetical protein